MKRKGEKENDFYKWIWVRRWVIILIIFKRIRIMG